ncbi:hypothetical protein JZ751_005463 [Albula glossodonta]|uniref:Dynein heavy chain C-terminal domain-containing protein n=1 Tax=Albula glossodonta TaxID=121402 RepID=A0A8T2N4X3_9TELE|nr:hypothetical protein JZ751_005463 [Albula glossodonta]
MCVKALLCAVTQSWVERAERQSLLTDTLDLSELFHPDTFLNALRQETARTMGCSMDSLKFVASWKSRITEAKLQVKSGPCYTSARNPPPPPGETSSPALSWGVTLARAIVRSLGHCFEAIAPSLCWTSHVVTAATTGREGSASGCYPPEECISLPVYTSAERVRLVTNIEVPCGGNSDQWVQCGAALFLKQQ